MVGGVCTDFLTNCLINRVLILMEIIRMDPLSFPILLPFVDRGREKFYRFYSGKEWEKGEYFFIKCCL